MKKKNTPEAKQFWALAEETSKLVKTWPQWKQDFARGYQASGATSESSTETTAKISETTD